jgi:glycerol-3-phosphate acyltransferase PlsY
LTADFPDYTPVTITIILVLLAGYLLGSIPSAYLAGRIGGIDIRQVGSGNVGATNVTRTFGKRFGYPVFVVDFLKGVAAVGLSVVIFGRMQPAGISRELCGVLAGISSVIGHSFPVWLGFKGGKGVATSAGVIFALLPLAAVVMGVVWIGTFQITRYVSLASIAAVVALPLVAGAMLLLGRLHAPVLLYFSIFLAVIVIVRHRSNLSRLASGTEPRSGQK